jgi:hypothetical protein
MHYQTLIKHPSFKKFCLLSLLYIIAYSPIMMWAYPESDDLKQMVTNMDWSHEGRILPGLIYRFMSGSAFVLDASPFYQIISLMILAVTTLILCKCVTGGIRTGELLFFIPAALFPFITHIMIYKVHSLFMALSLLLAIAPFVLRNRCKNMFIFTGLTILCLISVLTMFQPALNAYIILTIWFTMTSVLDKTKPLQKTLAGIAFYTALFTGAVLIFFILKKINLFTYTNPYGSAVSSFSSWAALTAFNMESSSLTGRLFFYAGRFANWFMHNAMGMIIFLFIMLFIVIIIKKALKLKIGIFRILLVLFLIPALFIAPAFIQLPMLRESFAPRHIYAWSILFSLIFFFNKLSLQNKIFLRIYKLLSLYLIMLFIFFPGIYTSVNRYQKEYERTIALAVADDVENYRQTIDADTVTVYLNGIIPYSPLIRTAITAYPGIKQMLNFFPNSVMRIFINNSYLSDITFNIRENPPAPRSAFTLLKEHALYTIYMVNDGTLFIEFPNENSSTRYQNPVYSFLSKVIKPK